jgi:hypothetical protein
MDELLVADEQITDVHISILSSQREEGGSECRRGGPGKNQADGDVI